ncbi:MAG: hypothetical protein AB7O49_15160 [Sphingomonadales bacterium]
MRALACLLMLAMPAFPALADEAGPGHVGDAALVAAPDAVSEPADAVAQPRKKRALACPACVTDEMPSFAIRPATEGQAAESAPLPDAGGASAGDRADAASEPPVDFSFAASGQSYSNRNRYRGGVYMSAPF